MKRILILEICVVLLLPFTVNATGGALRKNSIKTCSNGVTYGLHSDGHGGTHWHVAATNGKNYYATGHAIYSDPCPGYKKNAGTARSTVGNSKSSSSSSGNSKPSSSSSGNSKSSSSSSGNSGINNNYLNNNTQSNASKEVIIEKSKDNSIKKVVIDNEQITISDNMNFKTEKKYVDIKVEANYAKAKVEFVNKNLSLGQNIINIAVIAENGDKKNYTLTINKIKGKGIATIKKFILDAGLVEFESNKATVTKLKNESSLKYSYELSDDKAKLIMYLNEKETTELSGLKENDIIKLVVVDENDNENVYEITVTNASTIYSIIVYGIAFFIFFSPIVGIVIAIILIKKKKKKINN